MRNNFTKLLHSFSYAIINLICLSPKTNIPVYERQGCIQTAPVQYLE